MSVFQDRYQLYYRPVVTRLHIDKETYIFTTVSIILSITCHFFKNCFEDFVVSQAVIFSIGYSKEQCSLIFCFLIFKTLCTCFGCKPIKSGCIELLFLCGYWHVITLCFIFHWWQSKLCQHTAGSVKLSCVKVLEATESTNWREVYFFIAYCRNSHYC
jgi:hypothetical protein